MASKKDADAVIETISQIRNQVKETIKETKNTREAVNQQVIDLQRQVSELHNKTNEVLNNHVDVLESLDQKLVHCSKILENPSMVSDTEKDTTTDVEACTSAGSSGADSDENYDHSKSNDSVNISEPKDHSINNNTPGSEHLQFTPEFPGPSDIVMVEKTTLHVKKTLCQPLKQKRDCLTWNRVMLAQKTHEGDDGKFIQSDLEDIKIIDGYGEEQFKYPYLLANGPNNELIVSDRDSHQLIVFDNNLQFLHTFGGRGKDLENGTFYNPTGLAVDKIGSFLYVGDQSNHIQRFKIEKDSSCTFVSRFGAKGTGKGQFNCPCGLLFTQSKQLFVCDYRNHRIQVFDKEGKFLHSFGRHGSKPGDFKEPHCIAINSTDDKVFITDHSNNRIQVFSPHGKFLAIIDNGPSLNQRLQYPRGIIYTPDGHLLVSCTYTHCILELKEDGGFVSTTEEIIQPCGIVLKCNGDIVVTSNVNQSLVVIRGWRTDSYS